MTTSRTATHVAFREYRFLHVLAVLFVCVVAASGYRAVMPADWWVEQVLVAISIAFLVATYRLLPLSQLSYALIFVFLCMHEWGSHYRYGIDPIGEWAKQFQHTTRNQFDRWTHLAFGLLCYYPQREALIRGSKMRGAGAFWLPVILLLGYGAGYELMEAFGAAVLSPETAAAFLALQDDPWDTHKDMFMAVTGGTIAMIVTLVASRRRDGRG